MNFEVDVYVDALKDLPSKEIRLETQDGTYFHFKTDIFKALISYSTSPDFGANVVTITAKRAKEIIALNKQGKKPESLLDPRANKEPKATSVDYENVVGQDSLTRFDKEKKRRNNNDRSRNRRNNNNNSNNNNSNSNTQNNRSKQLKKPNRNNNSNGNAK